MTRVLTYLQLERRDLAALGGLTAIAFVLRFFSPLMPDVIAHPLSGPPVSNCVRSTPVDARGTPGTLCGLAYPFQRGYASQPGAQPQPPEGEIFDEIYFGVFAHDDLKGIAYFDPEPPLAKEVIASGEWLWGWWKATFLGYRGSYADLGFDTFGWRLMVCLFGTLVVPMLYLLALALWPDRFFALAAGVLACFDGMFFVQSRIGMIDIIPIFLLILAYWVFLLHWRSRTRAEALVTLFATGICVGLAVAAKWISLAALATMLFFLGLRYVRARAGPRLGAGGWRWDWGAEARSATPGGVPVALYLAALAAALLALPAAIYAASWFPFFLRGQFHTLGDVWTYQVQSFEYHAHLTAGHPYGSRWFTWPVLVRPVAYYFENAGLGMDVWTGRSLVAWIVNLGNPWIWWTSLPCLLLAAWWAIRERAFPPALISVGFLTQYLPWSRITRVVFLYHMFGGLVFMVLSLAFVLGRLARLSGVEIQFGESARLQISGRALACGHLVIAVLFFLYFYPLWTGLPLGDQSLLSGFPGGKAWFPTWV